MGTAGLITRDRIVQQGLDLLSRVGLAGVTLGPLADEVGLSKSGLYAHFRSKEAVQIALLDRMADVANQVVVAPAFAAPPGLARLRALVTNWLGWTARAGLRGGCPVAAAMFELDDIDGPVRDHVVQLEARWRGLLRTLTCEAMQTGELNRDLDADQFVWELCGIYLSHHASSRFLKDPASQARADTAFSALLARAHANPAAPPSQMTAHKTNPRKSKR